MNLIIVRGLPGSGKSTFAKELNIFHIEIDMFCMINGQYRWNAEQGRKRSNLCFQATRFALEEGIDAIVSNCFTRRADIEPYIQLAKKHHATLSIHSMAGQFPSIHPVPSDVITRMRETWEIIPGEISH